MKEQQGSFRRCSQIHQVFTQGFLMPAYCVDTEIIANKLDRISSFLEATVW